MHFKDNVNSLLCNRGDYISCWYIGISNNFLHSDRKTQPSVAIVEIILCTEIIYWNFLFTLLLYYILNENVGKDKCWLICISIAKNRSLKDYRRCRQCLQSSPRCPQLVVFCYLNRSWLCVKTCYANITVWESFLKVKLQLVLWIILELY